MLGVFLCQNKRDERSNFKFYSLASMNIEYYYQTHQVPWHFCYKHDIIKKYEKMIVYKFNTKLYSLRSGVFF